jgi:hypothetical protein
MLKLLLDEQISPDVAEGLRRKSRRMFVRCITEWEDGRFLGLADEFILVEAARQSIILVTYDRKTIPPVLKSWAQDGKDHCGVVFVDPETIPSSDFGGLIWALQKLWAETGDWDWTNRIVTLRR